MAATDGSAPHVPILRWGEPYESLDRQSVRRCAGGTAGELSLANAGLIRRDLRRAEAAAETLRRVPVERWLGICADAAEGFVGGTLPLGELDQSPDAYVALTSETTGLPHPMVRQAMRKIHTVLTGMEAVLRGLTRGLDPRRLDTGGGGLRFARAGACLGNVLPSNAPGVNGVWLPALPLKVPVLIKPGRQDPWTPFRLIQAFLAAGCPREAFSFYPTDHAGADLLLRKSGCGIVFGGAQATARYATLPTVEIHGPGRSKVLFGADTIGSWPDLLEVVIDSVTANAGRSCIDALTVLVPADADALADALARRLGPLAPLPADDEQASVAAFPDPRVAEALDQRLESALAGGGVRDVTAAYRQGPRRVTFEGATYLRPTVLRVDDPAHPLASAELPFVFLSVVECPVSELLRAATPSLVVTALTRDQALIDALAKSPAIDRLHVGPRPTTRIDWTQPHEGNLFELLYRRRGVAHAAWEAVSL